MASYLIFWSKDRIETGITNGDAGPLPVICGGHHIPLTRVDKARTGKNRMSIRKPEASQGITPIPPGPGETLLPRIRNPCLTSFCHGGTVC